MLTIRLETSPGLVVFSDASQFPLNKDNHLPFRINDSCSFAIDRTIVLFLLNPFADTVSPLNSATALPHVPKFEKP